MKKVNPRKILETFMSEISKHSDKITNKDETYFLTCEDDFMKEINVKHWWTSDLSNSTKEAIWQYLNTLFVLGSTITAIPSDLLKTIEGVAENCADQMGGDTSLDTSNIGNLMAGMQNMIGNMMPQLEKQIEKK